MSFAAMEFSRLVRLADVMMRSHRPDEVIADGLVAARWATGADLAPFFLLDQKHESLRLVAQPHERRLLAGYERLPVTAYARMPQLLSALSPIVISDLAHPQPDDFLPEQVSANLSHDLHSGAVVPLVSGGQLTGVMCLSFESQQLGSPEWISFLALVGRIIGTSIAHARTTKQLRDLAREDPERAGSHQPVNLTAREAQVAGLVADGLSNAAIGQILNLSPETVKKNLSRIMDKLQVHNRVQVATRLLREGQFPLTALWPADAGEPS